MVRPPSQWPYAQHDFHEAYNDDAAPFPRAPVWWRILEPPVASARADLQELRTWLWDPPPWRDTSLGAVWPVDAAPGTKPTLVFEVDFDGVGTEGPGTLVGEFEMNGALCVETSDRGTVWPTYNPRPPGRLRIRR